MKRSASVVGLATWCLVVAVGHTCLLASAPTRAVPHAAGAACPSQSAKPVARVVCQMIGVQQTLRSESKPRASLTIDNHPSPLDVVQLPSWHVSSSPSALFTMFRPDIHVRHRVLRL